MNDDEVGSATIHCLDCDLSADVKASDLSAWAEIGCPECGSGHNPEIDIGTGKGSVDTAIHNPDGSITCTICKGRIHSHWTFNDENGDVEGTILRESEVEIEGCPSCLRAFDKMRSEGFI